MLPSFDRPVDELIGEDELRNLAPSIDHNTDELPFSVLGGRRFEILGYLLEIDDADEIETVTLVRASGDKSRDILVHQNGTLARIIQCKNLLRKADGELRALRRERGAGRRARYDRDLTVQMAQEISGLFPGCPPQEALAIAERSARRGSGRVGRTAAAQSLEDSAADAGSDRTDTPPSHAVRSPSDARLRSRPSPRSGP
jgi:hypothetical protein